MRKQYSGQVETQRKKRSFRTELSFCFFWSEQLLVIETSPHSWVTAAMATLLRLCWSGQAQWGRCRAQKRSGYRLGWVFLFCFVLCILGDFNSWVCGWLLETCLTYNKSWPKGQIFIQITAWKESIKVFVQ